MSKIFSFLYFLFHFILNSQLSIINYQLLSDLPLLLPAFGKIDIYNKTNTDIQTKGYLGNHICFLAKTILNFAGRFNLYGHSNKASYKFCTSSKEQECCYSYLCTVKTHFY